MAPNNMYACAADGRHGHIRGSKEAGQGMNITKAAPSCTKIAIGPLTAIHLLSPLPISNHPFPPASGHQCYSVSKSRPSQVEVGPLIGGPPICRMSILRNCNVACPCRLFSPMSHVELKKRLCHYIFSPCHMSLSPMSHVEFKKVPCRPVDFRGQGPWK